MLVNVGIQGVDVGYNQLIPGIIVLQYTVVWFVCFSNVDGGVLIFVLLVVVVSSTRSGRDILLQL